MNFEKKTMQAMECYISGVYKCVKYGKNWFAYFRPVGWKNWGQSCEKTNTESSKPYKSLRGAQAACKRHFKMYGNSPEQFDKILNN